MIGHGIHRIRILVAAEHSVKINLTTQNPFLR